jgi:DNA primase
MSVTDEIKERLDVVQVISKYVSLRKAGHNYQGLCPFHNEKTPSFVVFPDTQNWHCFGACGTGGDIFTFLMKRENLDFGEALRTLAQQAGVTLEPARSASPESDQHHDRLRELLAASAAFYHHLLTKANEAADARAYLTRRGFTPATWEEWQLGYSLDSWDALKSHLAERGYAVEELAEAGMVAHKDEETAGPIRYYDRFRGRLMIPIRDGQGRNIGFGARILHEDPAHPAAKYINSPQTSLFDKSNVLYGLDKARKAIRAADLAVLVEGYMDVIGSHQAGVQNVVAGMGTAMTEGQLYQLKRLTSNVTLALDPDAAGEHATARGLDIARQLMERESEPVLTPSGLVRHESRLKAQLRIATLPDGLDPDELALKDVARWRQAIAEARSLVEYYLSLASSEVDLKSAQGKSALVARMGPLVQEIANPLERTHYTQRIARLIEADERMVAGELEKAARAASAASRGPTTGTAPVVTADPRTARTAGGNPTQASGDAAERARRNSRGIGSANQAEHLLALLLCHSDLLPRLDAEMDRIQTKQLSSEDLTNEEDRALLAVLRRPEMRVDLVWAERQDLLPVELQPRAANLLVTFEKAPELTDERITKDAVATLLNLRARRITEQLTHIQYLMQDGEAEFLPERLSEYEDLVLSYTTQKRKIQHLLSARRLTTK